MDRIRVAKFVFSLDAVLGILSVGGAALRNCVCIREYVDDIFSHICAICGAVGVALLWGLQRSHERKSSSKIRVLVVCRGECLWLSSWNRDCGSLHLALA